MAAFWNHEARSFFLKWKQCNQWACARRIPPYIVKRETARVLLETVQYLKALEQGRSRRRSTESTTTATSGLQCSPRAPYPLLTPPSTPPTRSPCREAVDGGHLRNHPENFLSDRWISWTIWSALQRSQLPWKMCLELLSLQFMALSPLTPFHTRKEVERDQKKKGKASTPTPAASSADASSFSFQEVQKRCQQDPSKMCDWMCGYWAASTSFPATSPPHASLSFPFFIPLFSTSSSFTSLPRHTRANNNSNSNRRGGGGVDGVPDSYPSPFPDGNHTRHADPTTAVGTTREGEFPPVLVKEKEDATKQKQREVHERLLRSPTVVAFGQVLHMVLRRHPELKGTLLVPHAVLSHLCDLALAGLRLGTASGGSSAAASSPLPWVPSSHRSTRRNTLAASSFLACPPVGLPGMGQHGSAGFALSLFPLPSRAGRGDRRENTATLAVSLLRHLALLEEAAEGKIPTPNWKEKEEERDERPAEKETKTSWPVPTPHTGRHRYQTAQLAQQLSAVFGGAGQWELGLRYLEACKDVVPRNVREAFAAYTRMVQQDQAILEVIRQEETKKRILQYPLPAVAAAIERLPDWRDAIAIYLRARASAAATAPRFDGLSGRSQGRGKDGNTAGPHEGSSLACHRPLLDIEHREGSAGRAVEMKEEMRHQAGLPLEKHKDTTMPRLKQLDHSVFSSSSSSSSFAKEEEREKEEALSAGEKKDRKGTQWEPHGVSSPLEGHETVMHASWNHPAGVPLLDALLLREDLPRQGASFWLRVFVILPPASQTFSVLRTILERIQMEREGEMASESSSSSSLLVPVQREQHEEEWEKDPQVGWPGRRVRASETAMRGTTRPFHHLPPPSQEETWSGKGFRQKTEKEEDDPLWVLHLIQIMTPMVRRMYSGTFTRRYVSLLRGRPKNRGTATRDAPDRHGRGRMSSPSRGNKRKEKEEERGNPDWIAAFAWLCAGQAYDLALPLVPYLPLSLLLPAELYAFEHAARALSSASPPPSPLPPLSSLSSSGTTTTTTRGIAGPTPPQHPVPAEKGAINAVGSSRTTTTTTTPPPLPPPSSFLSPSLSSLECIESRMVPDLLAIPDDDRAIPVWLACGLYRTWNDIEPLLLSRQVERRGRRTPGDSGANPRPPPTTTLNSSRAVMGMMEREVWWWEDVLPFSCGPRVRSLLRARQAKQLETQQPQPQYPPHHQEEEEEEEAEKGITEYNGAELHSCVPPPLPLSSSRPTPVGHTETGVECFVYATIEATQLVARFAGEKKRRYFLQVIPATVRKAYFLHACTLHHHHHDKQVEEKDATTTTTTMATGDHEATDSGMRATRSVSLSGTHGDSFFSFPTGLPFSSFPLHPTWGSTPVWQEALSRSSSPAMASMVESASCRRPLTRVGGSGEGCVRLRTYREATVLARWLSKEASPPYADPSSWSWVWKEECHWKWRWWSSLCRSTAGEESREVVLLRRFAQLFASGLVQEGEEVVGLSSTSTPATTATATPAKETENGVQLVEEDKVAGGGGPAWPTLSSCSDREEGRGGPPREGNASASWRSSRVLHEETKSRAPSSFPTTLVLSTGSSSWWSSPPLFVPPPLRSSPTRFTTPLFAWSSSSTSRGVYFSLLSFWALAKAARASTPRCHLDAMMVLRLEGWILRFVHPSPEIRSREEEDEGEDDPRQGFTSSSSSSSFPLPPWRNTVLPLLCAELLEGYVLTKQWRKAWRLYQHGARRIFSSFPVSSSSSLLSSPSSSCSTSPARWPMALRWFLEAAVKIGYVAPREVAIPVLDDIQAQYAFPPARILRHLLSTQDPREVVHEIHEMKKQEAVEAASCRFSSAVGMEKRKKHHHHKTETVAKDRWNRERKGKQGSIPYDRLAARAYWRSQEWLQHLVGMAFSTLNDISTLTPVVHAVHSRTPREAPHPPRRRTSRGGEKETSGEEEKDPMHPGEEGGERRGEEVSSSPFRIGVTHLDLHGFQRVLFALAPCAARHSMLLWHQRHRCPPHGFSSRPPPPPFPPFPPPSTVQTHWLWRVLALPALPLPSESSKTLPLSPSPPSLQQQRGRPAQPISLLPPLSIRTALCALPGARTRWGVAALAATLTAMEKGDALSALSSLLTFTQEVLGSTTNGGGGFGWRWPTARAPTTPSTNERHPGWHHHPIQEKKGEKTEWWERSGGVWGDGRVPMEDDALWLLPVVLLLRRFCEEEAIVSQFYPPFQQGCRTRRTRPGTDVASTPSTTTSTAVTSSSGGTSDVSTRRTFSGEPLPQHGMSVPERSPPPPSSFVPPSTRTMDVFSSTTRTPKEEEEEEVVVVTPSTVPFSSSTAMLFARSLHQLLWRYAQEKEAYEREASLVLETWEHALHRSSSTTTTTGREREEVWWSSLDGVVVDSTRNEGKEPHPRPPARMAQEERGPQRMDGRLRKALQKDRRVIAAFLAAPSTLHPRVRAVAPMCWVGYLVHCLSRALQRPLSALLTSSLLRLCHSVFEEIPEERRNRGFSSFPSMGTSSFVDHGHPPPPPSSSSSSSTSSSSSSSSDDYGDDSSPRCTYDPYAGLSKVALFFFRSLRAPTDEERWMMWRMARHLSDERGASILLLESPAFARGHPNWIALLLQYPVDHPEVQRGLMPSSSTPPSSPADKVDPFSFSIPLTGIDTVRAWIQQWTCATRCVRAKAFLSLAGYPEPSSSSHTRRSSSGAGGGRTSSFGNQKEKEREDVRLAKAMYQILEEQIRRLENVEKEE